VGIAILLTDHNVHETLKVTDRSYVIDRGQVISDGTPHELINDPRVRERYLGNTFQGDEFAPPPAPGYTSVRLSQNPGRTKLKSLSTKLKSWLVLFQEPIIAQLLT
jgi:energy-coupling factor transporter ATP-binding protein EcfA2